MIELEEAYETAKKTLLDWKSILDGCGTDLNKSEVTLFHKEQTVQINLRKLDFLFLLIQLDRRVIEYSLKDFNSISQIKELIDSFFQGQYLFNMGIDNIPIQVNWENEALRNLDRKFQDIVSTDVKQFEGYIWK